MKITSFAVSLVLLAALGINAQAQSVRTREPSSSGLADAACAAGSHDSAVKLDEESMQRRQKEPRPNAKQAPRPLSRIVTFEPVLPFGQ